MNDHTYYVYVLASGPRGTLYIGVTSDLVKRVYEHRTQAVPGFTTKHDIHRLVFYELHSNIEAAILREKRIKRWRRDWKIALIEEGNSNWDDLWQSIAGLE